MAATKLRKPRSQECETSSTLEIVSSMASAMCTKLTVAVPRTSDAFSVEKSWER
jgi:hypothetical protein